MDGARVAAGNKGHVQVIRDGARKRFDAGRRQVFLDWMGATCNLRLSAEKAGVAPITVMRHRRRDPGFAEEWRVALEQGVARLEAELLAAAWPEAAEAAADATGFDAEMGLKIYKTLHGAPAATPAAGRGGRTPRVATDNEMRAELVRRLGVLRRRKAGE